MSNSIRYAAALDILQEVLRAPRMAYATPRISPEGERIAVAVGTLPSTDIWIYSLPRDNLMRLTFDEAFEYAPLWSPNGQRVFFTKRFASALNLVWKAANGTGALERLTTNSRNQVFNSSSEAGQLVFECDGPTQCDIGTLPLQTDSQVELLLQTEYSKTGPALSSDGSWLAFASDESGRPEVYVRPFPAVESGRWQVSNAGGLWPIWSPDGRELFYLSDNGMMAVAVKTEPDFALDSPRPLFDTSTYQTAFGRDYDISPDGTRFLMVKPVISTNPEVVVILNWLDELKRLVPND